MALEYHESYSRTIVLLFLLVAVKRILTDVNLSLKEFVLLLGALAIFYMFKLMYT